MILQRSLKIEELAQREPLLKAFTHLPLLEGVSHDALLALFVAAEEHMVRKGQVIVREGEQGKHLFVVGKGSVEVVRGLGTPHQTVLAVLGQNEFFGDMCIIEPIVRTASISALQTSFLYAISSSSLNKLYQVWPDQHCLIMRNLARELAKRIEVLDSDFSARAR